ncbi:MAG: hypothetical protein RIS64_4166 [Bacteroidota bacterium]
MNKYDDFISEILAEIQKSKDNSTQRTYATFFQRIGMPQRRHFASLLELAQGFKARNITLWLSDQLQNSLRPAPSLSELPKGYFIVFKQSAVSTPSLEASVLESNLSAKVGYAGTIRISPSESRLKPYEHQTEAFEKLQEKIIKSQKNPFAGLLVLPTGGGKTLTAALWIAQNILDKKKKVLWIAHRHELLEQAKNTFVDKLAYKDIFATIESFNYRMVSGIHDKAVNIRESDQLVIASKDSLSYGFEHLNRIWFEKGVDEVFLVIDEAHHATATTYRKLIEKIQGSVSKFALLGLTATPTRTAENERGLLHKIFPDDIVYKIDLKTLIRLGILSTPVFEEAATGQNFMEELSPEDIERINNLDIGSIGKEIATNIANNSVRNHLIVDRYVQNKEKYKQTLVFALNQDNAIALHALFQAKKVKSAFVIASVTDAATGSSSQFTKENGAKIEQFRKGELEVLINVNILTEGTDVPNVQSVFLTRPTISTILMTQMIGRGLRGPKAGGTAEAYIVSFMDDWQDKFAWVNPEKLVIDETIDFSDNVKESKKQLLRLVAISKMEEFAILADRIIDSAAKKEIERLDFIQRIPKGIYQFRFLEPSQPDEAMERVCEILVYDNFESAYQTLMQQLPAFVEGIGSDYVQFYAEHYAEELEKTFFQGVAKYPAYRRDDIKNLLKYYTIQGAVPPYLLFSDREKYDVDRLATEMHEKGMNRAQEKAFIDRCWEDSETAWQTFFNYDKLNLRREINLAMEKLIEPELYQSKQVKPVDEKEIRTYEKMDMGEIYAVNPAYERDLRDKVFQKFTDSDGFYFSEMSPHFKSKNRANFRVDHIVSRFNGGLTVLDNLQLLTLHENAKKGRY